MRIRRAGYAVSLMILLSVGAMAAASEGTDGPNYAPSQKEFYLNQADMAFLQPGLNIKIQSVQVTGTTVVVTFSLTDGNNQGLDRAGANTPGTVTTSFILARIKPGDTQYTSYTTRVQLSPITGVSATQAGTDTGGSYTTVDLANGVYKYTFGFKLPADDPADATHTVGVYGTRDLRTIANNLGLTQLASIGIYYSNDTFNFTPSGKAVSQVRDVVTTAACNECHDPLALHGGSRRETRLCILCHQPQTIDPDTGNTVDFKVMIHKIHQGAFLPSVMNHGLNPLGTSGSGTGTTATGATAGPIAPGTVPAGKRYQIIGFSPTPVDFSGVVWPQDTRNCVTCHQGTTQSDNYKTNPTRVACGSCHDDVNFDTGANHAGGAQLDDTKCTICHPADTGLEFDFSVVGSHTIPTKSKQLTGLVINITGVTGTTPGSKPTVSFTLADKKGNPLALSALGALAFTMAGPTSEYTYPTGRPATENALTAAVASGSGYKYTFTTGAIPAGSKGSFTIGAQGFRNVTIPGSLLGQSFAVRDMAKNTLVNFSVDGSATAARRAIVDLKNCNGCHETLALHGGSRTDTAYCVTCHESQGTDNSTPAQTINFRTHIHRIHTGAELENPWVFGNTNYNGLEFPGDRRNCTECHVASPPTYTLPVATKVFPVNPSGFYSPWGPAASACLGCHDGQDAAAHAFLQTAAFPNGTAVESCTVCHEEGADFAVTRVHAR
jgi:OmcA/MtrC family decaheme c-type cytochrome